MDIRTVQGDITEVESPAIVVNLFEGVAEPSGATGAVDQALQGAIAALIADGEIKGKKCEMTLVHTLGNLAARRVLVTGLGKSEDLTVDVVRGAAGETARFLRSKGVVSFASVVHGSGAGGLGTEECAQAMAEGTLMGLYRFDQTVPLEPLDDDFLVEVSFVLSGMIRTFEPLVRTFGGFSQPSDAAPAPR